MIQTVVKRDGRIVGFNDVKIKSAIRKAMLVTDKGEDDVLIQKITDHIATKGKSQMSVEAIQDAVEVELMKSARKDVAQKYIAYRNQRSIARKAKTRDVFMEIVKQGHADRRADQIDERDQESHHGHALAEHGHDLAQRPRARLFQIRKNQQCRQQDDARDDDNSDHPN